MSGPSVSEYKPTNSDIPSIDDKDFPSLYQSADQAAIQMQRHYFWLNRSYLFLLIIGGGFAAFASMIPAAYSTWFRGVIIIILTIGIAINVISRMLKYDEKWFECRAIAESTKNATWRFMMRATPFDNMTPKDIFISKIREIRNDRQSILESLALYKDVDAELISDFMMNVRSKSMEERREYYLELRLRDQKIWYSKKAGSNSTSKSRWLTITLVLQVFAIIFSIIQFIFSWSMNLVPILMTCAAAAIAWSQMKRYRELAQSYTMVAHELEELEAISLDVTQESEFCEFVNDVEYAISREHTMWCVRRDVTVNPNNHK